MALSEQEQWTARNFIGALAQVVNPEQSFANQDSYAYNPTRQYTVIGPNGNGLEGGTGRGTFGGGMMLSPMVLMLGAAALAAVFFLKKG